MNKMFTTLFLACLVISCSDKESKQPQVNRTVLTMEVSANNHSSQHLYAGKLRAQERASLSFEVPGTITNINVHLGDQIQAGQVLALLDNEQYELQLQARKAELEATRSQYQDAKLEFERLDNLSSTGAVSKSSLDRAKAQMDTSFAQLAGLQAGVDNALKQLEYTVLTAPYTGEVVSRLAEPSQTVNTGQPIVEVVGLEGGLEVVLFVPNEIRANLSQATKAVLRLLPNDIEIAASVSEIGGRANAAGLFQVVLKVSGQANEARAGQSVEVALNITNRNQDVPVIPVTGYGMNANGDAYVYLVKGNQVFQQQVELGAMSDLGVEVLSGLEDGERIVTKGVELLHNEQVVNPVDHRNNQFGL